MCHENPWMGASYTHSLVKMCVSEEMEVYEKGTFQGHVVRFLSSDEYSSEICSHAPSMILVMMVV